MSGVRDWSLVGGGWQRSYRSMQLDLFSDAEGWADAVAREARLDGDEAPDPRLIAKRLGVTLVSAPARSILGGVGQMGRLGDGYLIRRAAGLAPSHAAFVVAHELGHVTVRRLGLRVDDEEAWANAFAGALLLPRSPLQRVWRRGCDLGDVLEAWPNVPPTCAALRIGEARLADTIVIQGRVARYVRGEIAPSPELIPVAIEAVRSGRASRPGIAKAWRLPEVPRRAALVLDLDSALG